MFKADIATLFPSMCESVLNCSILKRARDFNLVDVNVYNIRDFSTDKHKKVDDYPYGGGEGMLLKADPIYRCYEYAKLKRKGEIKVIYFTPQGKTLTQKKIISFAKTQKALFLLCGHYEGVDQRVIDEIVDEEISIGDYVLTGGELAALVFLDAVIRLIPFVLKSSKSFEEESHFNGLLEHPQYTRPKIWKNHKVPDVLLSGNHKKIKEWKEKKTLEITKLKRPDMLE